MASLKNVKRTLKTFLCQQSAKNPVIGAIRKPQISRHAHFLFTPIQDAELEVVAPSESQAICHLILIEPEEPPSNQCHDARRSHRLVHPSSFVEQGVVFWNRIKDSIQKFIC